MQPSPGERGLEEEEEEEELREIAVSAVRERIADVLGHVAHKRERIILTRHGRQLGALVPMEDLERLRLLEAGDESRAMTAYRASWKRVTDALHRN